MIRIAQVWADGYMQVAAFAGRQDAAEHLAWIACHAVLFAPKAYRYVRATNGRFAKASTFYRYANGFAPVA